MHRYLGINHSFFTPMLSIASGLALIFSTPAGKAGTAPSLPSIFILGLAGPETNGVGGRLVVEDLLAINSSIEERENDTDFRPCLGLVISSGVSVMVGTANESRCDLNEGESIDGDLPPL